jgi:hypothetical protein
MAQCLNEHIESFHMPNEPDEQQMVAIARLIGARRAEHLFVDDVWNYFDWHRLAEEIDDAATERIADRSDARDAWQRFFHLASHGGMTIEPGSPHCVLGGYHGNSELRTDAACDGAFRVDEVCVDEIERFFSVELLYSAANRVDAESCVERMK